MVRLVFRPYTQIRRTICTSVSLRASTRVSPGFTLFRHRSPSFGSQQICSYSNLHHKGSDRSIVPQYRFLPQRIAPPSLSLRIRVLNTQILAYMLDSLVRVSRRVKQNHFVTIANPRSEPFQEYYPRDIEMHCIPSTTKQHHQSRQPIKARVMHPQSEKWYYNQARRSHGSTPRE